MHATSSRSPLTLIVAATQSNGIGLGGGLPWRLPQEMKYFARVTTEGCGATPERPNAVVMGRKTWDGIPPRFRPLPSRRNLVVTRSTELNLSSSASTTVHNSLETALIAAGTRSNHTFLIGGAELYKLALTAEPAPLVDRILLTRIRSPAFEGCDAHLAEFRSDNRWSRASADELSAWLGWEVPRGAQSEKGVEYEFEMWVFQAADA